MTVLTLGSARTDTSLTAPVVRSATSADWLSGSMISPLVLSRQPCMTPGAGHSLGNGLGGSGGGGGGVDVGRGCQLRLGGERLRLRVVEPGASRPDEQRRTQHGEHTPHRPAQSHASQVTDRSAVRATHAACARRGRPANRAPKAPRQSPIRG